MKIEQKIGGISMEIDLDLSLWQAIKLRIVGKSYQPLIEEMIRYMKASFDNCIVEES